jgi:hypothetical protein
MRKTVEPPPISRCDRCGGQLTLKRVAVAHSIFGSNSNIFVCAGCGRERAFVVRDDTDAPHLMVSQSQPRR